MAIVAYQKQAYTPGIMKASICCAVFLAAAASAQTPSPHSYTSDLGFSYSLPGSWEVVDSRPTLPAVKQKAANEATSDAERKGIACIQSELTGRHGDPASVIVVVSLAYDCYGQAFSDKELPSFGTGVAEGVKANFDVNGTVFGQYSLGSHGMWVERAQGTPKNNPNTHYTIEIACGLLKKGAVCWLTLATDSESLNVFEQSVVSLEGDSGAALVPPTAFEKKPS